MLWYLPTMSCKVTPMVSRNGVLACKMVPSVLNSMMAWMRLIASMMAFWSRVSGSVFSEAQEVSDFIVSSPLFAVTRPISAGHGRYRMAGSGPDHQRCMLLPDCCKNKIGMNRHYFICARNYCAIEIF